MLLSSLPGEPVAGDLVPYFPVDEDTPPGLIDPFTQEIDLPSNPVSVTLVP